MLFLKEETEPRL